MSQFPPRFKLSGQLLNVFQTPKGTSREGRDYGGDFRVQMLSTDTLKNGEQKVVQSEVSIGESEADANQYKQFLGKPITLPVSVYSANGDIRVQLAAGVRPPVPSSTKATTTEDA